MRNTERINLTRTADKQIGLRKNQTLQKQENDRNYYFQYSSKC
jgi:hypothetical protein